MIIDDCDRWKVTYRWQMLWPQWQMELPQLYCKDISHMPSKVGVLESITFAHTPEEAMSVGLVKAHVL